jgi:hypothetical protein
MFDNTEKIRERCRELCHNWRIGPAWPIRGADGSDLDALLLSSGKKINEPTMADTPWCAAEAARAIIFVKAESRRVLVTNFFSRYWHIACVAL